MGWQNRLFVALTALTACAAPPDPEAPEETPAFAQSLSRPPDRCAVINGFSPGPDMIPFHGCVGLTSFSFQDNTRVRIYDSLGPEGDALSAAAPPGLRLEIFVTNIAFTAGFGGGDFEFPMEFIARDPESEALAAWVYGCTEAGLPLQDCPGRPPTPSTNPRHLEVDVDAVNMDRVHSYMLGAGIFTSISLEARTSVGCGSVGLDPCVLPIGPINVSPASSNIRAFGPAPLGDGEVLYAAADGCQTVGLSLLLPLVIGQYLSPMDLDICMPVAFTPPGTWLTGSYPGTFHGQATGFKASVTSPHGDVVYQGAPADEVQFTGRARSVLFYPDPDGSPEVVPVLEFSDFDYQPGMMSYLQFKMKQHGIATVQSEQMLTSTGAVPFITHDSRNMYITEIPDHTPPQLFDAIGIRVPDFELGFATVTDYQPRGIDQNGDTLVVYGTGFNADPAILGSGVTQVLQDGVAVPFVVDSDSQLRVTTRATPPSYPFAAAFDVFAWGAPPLHIEVLVPEAPVPRTGQPGWLAVVPVDGRGEPLELHFDSPYGATDYEAPHKVTQVRVGNASVPFARCFPGDDEHPYCDGIRDGLWFQPPSRDVALGYPTAETTAHVVVTAACSEAETWSGLTPCGTSTPTANDLLYYATEPHLYSVDLVDLSNGYTLVRLLGSNLTGTGKLTFGSVNRPFAQEAGWLICNEAAGGWSDREGCTQRWGDAEVDFVTSPGLDPVDTELRFILPPLAEVVPGAGVGVSVPLQVQLHCGLGSQSCGTSEIIYLTYPGTPQTITWDAVSPKTYGDPPFELFAESWDGATRVSDALSFDLYSGPGILTGDVLTLTGPGDVVVVTTAPGTDTYTEANSSLTIPVAPRPLTVTAYDATRPVLAENPVLSGVVCDTAACGILPGEQVTVSYTTTASVGSPPGDYPITPELSGADAANYALVATPGTLTVALPAPVVTVPEDGWITLETQTLVQGSALPGASVVLTLDGSAVAEGYDASSSGVTCPCTPGGSCEPTGYTASAVAGNGVQYLDDTGSQLIDGEYGVDFFGADLGNGSAYEWVGFADHDPEIVFEFPVERSFTTVTVGLDIWEPGGVIRPTLVSVEVSDDGVLFTPAGVVLDPAVQDLSRADITLDITGHRGRYVKVFLDGTNWLFLDEVSFGQEPSGPVDEACLPYAAEADGSGDWSVLLTDLAVSAHSLSATQRVYADGAWRTSEASATTSFTVYPSAPSITSPTAGSVTDSMPLRVTGTGAPLATVALRSDGSAAAAAVVQQDGTWAVDLDAWPGEHTLDAAQTLHAVTGAWSAPVVFTYTAPLAILTPENGSTFVPGTAIGFGGTGTPGTSIALQDNGASVASSVVAADGTWSASQALPEGAHVVTAVATPGGAVSNAVNVVVSEANYVAAWGVNDAGQTDVPLDVGSVLAISASNEEAIAIGADGVIHTWGRSNDPNQRPPELQAPTAPGAPHPTAIAQGDGYRMVLMDDGTLRAWGVRRSEWTNQQHAYVAPALTDVVAIAAGYVDLAVLSDGTVYSWDVSAPESPALLWQDGSRRVVAATTAGQATLGGAFFGAFLLEDGSVETVTFSDPLDAASMPQPTTVTHSEHFSGSYQSVVTTLWANDPCANSVGSVPGVVMLDSAGAVWAVPRDTNAIALARTGVYDTIGGGGTHALATTSGGVFTIPEDTSCGVPPAAPVLDQVVAATYGEDFGLAIAKDERLDTTLEFLEFVSGLGWVPVPHRTCERGLYCTGQARLTYTTDAGTFPASGRTVQLSMNGQVVQRMAAAADGVVSFDSFPVYGLEPGTYPDVLKLTFFGDTLRPVEVEADLVITRRSQNVYFPPDPPTKRYGDPPFLVSATSSAGLPVDVWVESGPGTVTDNWVTITGGGANIVLRASQPGNDEYFSAGAEWTVPVTRKELYVQGTTVTRLYGDPNPEFAAEFTGLVAGDEPGVTFSTYADENSFPSRYPIEVRIEDGWDDRYNTYHYDGTMIVVPRAPTITSPEAGHRTTNPLVTFEVSGLQLTPTSLWESGEEIVRDFAESDGVFRATITLDGYGEHILTASQGSYSDPDGEGPESPPVSVYLLSTPEVVTQAQSATEGAPASFSLGTMADPGSSPSPWLVEVDWGDGSPAPTTWAIVTGALPSLEHTYANSGAYVAEVTVTNRDGVATTESFDVTVDNVAPTPLIDGAPADAFQGDSLVLLASATDPSPADVAAGFTFGWIVERDGVVVESGAGDEHTLLLEGEGIYEVTLTATDQDGGSDLTSALIAVANAAPEPTISGVPEDALEGDLITLTGSATDGAEDVAAGFDYTWSVTRDGVPVADGDQAALSFAPDDDGTYTVTLAATDQWGAQGSTEITVVVGDVPPTATILDAPPQGAEGSELILTGFATDVSAADVAAGFTYAWTVHRNGVLVAEGDVSSLTFTPDDNGMHEVVLTVTDHSGATGAAAATIEVLNVAPTARIEGAPTEGVLFAEIVATAAVTDVSSADTAAGFANTWSATLDGAPWATWTGATFPFTPTAAGIYEVTLVATDKDGDTGTDQVSLCVATFECGDNDIDGDGVSDVIEGACGTDPYAAGSTPTPAELADPDADGEPNCLDLDDDGDDVPDTIDLCEGDDATGDDDLDGVCDDRDLCFGDDLTGDSDGDGLCDDLDFTLGLSAAVRGQLVSFYVWGAPPGANVYVFVSPRGPGQGPCAPNDPTACLGIRSPIMVGQVVSNANGRASTSVMVPPSAVLGMTVAAQAAWVQAGEVDMTQVGEFQIE